jgi:hypothetical protein
MPQGMVVELIPESAVEKRNKYAGFPEWKKIQEIMEGAGIPKGQALKVILSDATVQAFKGKDMNEKRQKALLGFRQKLAIHFNSNKKLRFQLANQVLTVRHKREKK